MSAESSRLAVNIGKMVILAFDASVLGVGFHSHLQSTWMAEIGKRPNSTRTYEVCRGNNSEKIGIPEGSIQNCPHISMEYYYMFVISVCFVLSLIGLIIGFFVSLRRFQPHHILLVDLGYHGISAVLLFVGAILYMISAIQIDHVVDVIKTTGNLPTEYNFRKTEKITAASMTIAQSMLYAVVAVLIGLGKWGHLLR